MTGALNVRALVAAVPDPELPFLTIEDLGILRSVTVTGTAVRVGITPTYSGCPATEAIRDDILTVLGAHGLTGSVATELSPPWTTDWITDRGRQVMAEHGISPPGRGPVMVQLSVACPQCGSRDTQELSRFGATACKSLWRCQACREPFERFKQH